MAFIDNTYVKTELKGSSSTNDDLIDQLIVQVLSLWDKLTKRTWATATFTEYHDGDGISTEIFTNNYPITAITSIHDDLDHDYETADLIDSDEYSYGDGLSGVVSCDYPFTKGKKNIKIVYTAGYTDANVPGWLKGILCRQVCHWFQQSFNSRLDVSSIAMPSGGGTTSYKGLIDNLLPDFMKAVEENRRVGHP